MNATILMRYLVGPLVGKYLSIWGVKAIFPAGFIIDGGTFILFGMLQWVNNTTMFLLFSYLIRFLEVHSLSIISMSNILVIRGLGPRQHGHLICLSSWQSSRTENPQ